MVRQGSRAVAGGWPLVGRDSELTAFEAVVDDPAYGGFLVVGTPGVGRTRLGEECLVRAAARGLPVDTVAASDTARLVPLGAFARHFAPEPADPLDVTAVELFTQARAVLAERTGGRRLVGFVDDFELLDSVSANLVAQLVEVGAVFLVAALRADRPLPDLAERLWTAGRAVRVDIGELDPPTVRRLLEDVLGGPVTVDTGATFATLSRGNVQHLRELVRTAVREGGLTRSDGVWHLASPLVTGPRLHELVAARLAAAGPEQRVAMEHLALCAPLEVAALLELVPHTALEELEAADLVTVERDGQRRWAALAHPLHAQVLRDGIPPARAQAILRTQIARLRRLGARRRGDVLRLATWQLAASGTADPELLVRAARLSLSELDFAEVERLAGAALAAGPTGELAAEARRVLGEALGHLDRPAEAEEHLAAASRVFAARPGPQLRRTAMMRAVFLAFSLGDPPSALQAIADARAVLPREHQDELAGTAALILTIGGDPGAALATIEGAPGGLARIPGPLGAQARATALAAAGRAVEALPYAAADVALGGTADLAPDPEGMPWPHVALRWLALSSVRYEAGQLPAAIEDARRGLDAAEANAPAEIIGNYHLGRYHLAAGRPRPRCATSA
ncbi:hypothetical protein BJF78_11705 [Pseudonocardia sp. CNS-139]|nr:hypothetical protein BJF78_11705 [Pseudonocardia sp. CNS-139]